MGLDRIPTPIVRRRKPITSRPIMLSSSAAQSRASLPASRASPPTASSASASAGSEEPPGLKKPDITDEEFEKIKKALKDEKFRELLHDYMKEISDPANKALYEREIEALERERGNNIRWVKPTPGCVLKTLFKRPPNPPEVPDDVSKVFINLCSSTEVAEATVISTMGHRNGKRGEDWTIPYSLGGQGRMGLDKSGQKCFIYDCLFHPATYRKGKETPAFFKLLASTAMEGIERRFSGVQLNREYKIVKSKYKGELKVTVVRAPAGADEKNSSSVNAANPESSLAFLESLRRQAPKTSSSSQSIESKEAKQATSPLIQEVSRGSSSTESKGPKRPSFTIVHQGHVSFDKFLNGPHRSVQTRPEALLVTISLPGIESAGDVDLDVEDESDKLSLVAKHQDSTEPVYALDAKLPFPVIGSNGTAKFVKGKSQLVVSLPVVPEALPCIETAPNVPIEREDENTTTRSENDTAKIPNVAPQYPREPESVTVAEDAPISTPDAVEANLSGPSNTEGASASARASGESLSIEAPCDFETIEETKPSSEAEGHTSNCTETGENQSQFPCSDSVNSLSFSEMEPTQSAGKGLTALRANNPSSAIWSIDVSFAAEAQAAFKRAETEVLGDLDQTPCHEQSASLPPSRLQAPNSSDLEEEAAEVGCEGEAGDSRVAGSANVPNLGQTNGITDTANPANSMGNVCVAEASSTQASATSLPEAARPKTALKFTNSFIWEMDY
ncbi:pre-RNA processing PIH1/Nop17-domain-containing protein [Zopfochytrium polystomum]|nr:pre-RNA processing PIH1/Nop17-domain-containing protein [Zopfochytrium polystomum]